MKSLMQAFCQFAMGGLPNAISAALTQATKAWTPNNLNDGHLPMVYVVNVAFCLVGTAAFIFFTPRLKGTQWRVAEDNSSEGSETSSTEG